MTIGFIQRQTCPLCQARDKHKLCEISFREQRLKTFLEEFYQGRVPLECFKSESYRVVICGQCDFIYQDSILDRKGMQALYLDWVDHAASLQKKQQARASLYRKYAGQVETLARVLPGRPHQNRILDYGMGWGYWSRMAQAHGFDVVGYELSARRSAHARSLGVEVIEALPGEGEHFDCVYASQVFEHLPDPLNSLREISARLVPGGVVYLRVPDGRGLVDRIERGGWSPELDAVHPFEHINCFTRKTLTAFAARASLKPINPPLRLNWGNLWNGIKREIADRYLTTHLFFRRD